MDDVWVVVVNVDGTLSTLVLNISLIYESPPHGILGRFDYLFWFSLLHGLLSLLLFLLCPSVFLLEMINIWGKSSLGKMCVIHLLIVCVISKLCSVYYAGLQHRASIVLGTQIFLVSGELNIFARCPGGATETWLKLCGPSKTWYVDSWGWVCVVQSILNLSCACLISLHHSTDEELSSHVLRHSTV